MSHIIDFHSHILPGIDDGSASVEESVAMLKMEAAQGISHVVATPHFYAQHDTVEHFLKRRKEAELRLREAMEKEEGMPALSIGAEVYYFRGISQSSVLQDLTIDQKKCTLIEMPYAVWSSVMYQELERIHVQQGLTPIVAHVDRYFKGLRTFGIPKQLDSLPVLVQANASFFCRPGFAGRALQMLDRGQIHLLGSDCHNTHNRAPNLGEAVGRIQNRFGSSMLDQIVEYQQFVFSEQ